MNLSRKIEQAFSNYKSKPAISHYVSASTLRSLTFGQLEKQVKDLALFFTTQGLQPGDLVACYMNKTIDSVVTILAALYNGGAACSLNSRLKPHQVIKLSAFAKPRFVVLDRTTLNPILKSDEAMASGERFVFYSNVPELLKQEKNANDLHSSRQISNAAPGDGEGDALIPAYSQRPDSRGYCLFTSGSTGEQKGVLISRDDLVNRVATEIEDYEISKEDRLLSLLPFSFDVGLNQLLSSVLSGAHLVILNSWFPKDIVAAIKRTGITGISAVPTIWADMLSFPQDRTFHHDIRTLRYITVSGGDLAPAYLRQLRQYFEALNIYKTYGQSETFRSCILRPHDFEKKMTSVGQAVKGTQVFILDENGMVASPEREGEIVHYGAGTMLGYINDTQGTQKKIREIPWPLKEMLTEGNVVFTGDRGKMDGEGYLYMLGREDGMIKTSGYRVYPKEVENCILEFPEVRHCAVLGISDGRKGHSMIAEVVPKDMLTKEELIKHLRERLPSYMIPDEIYFVESLPLAENGKIRYAEIKGRYEKGRVL